MQSYSGLEVKAVVYGNDIRRVDFHLETGVATQTVELAPTQRRSRRSLEQDVRSGSIERV